LLTTILITLFVFSTVVVVIVIRDATQYSPESRLRLWATRTAVAVIILWFASGLLVEMKTRLSVSEFLTSRTFFRGILAIVLVWLTFRDEL
jgi:anaerobic C4-dicarboxylate transporter